MPLNAYGNTQYIAPLPDLLVVQAVDGLVFPYRAGAFGGQRRGVGGVGLVVDVEQHKTFVVASVHPPLSRRP